MVAASAMKQTCSPVSSAGRRESLGPPCIWSCSQNMLGTLRPPLSECLQDPPRGSLSDSRSNQVDSKTNPHSREPVSCTQTLPKNLGSQPVLSPQSTRPPALLAFLQVLAHSHRGSESPSMMLWGHFCYNQASGTFSLESNRGPAPLPQGTLSWSTVEV